MSNTSEITSEDLIFYKEGDKIYSGGFNINSILLKKGISPLNSLNRDSYDNSNTIQSSDKVSDLFNNMAVPSGLLYSNSFKPNSNYEDIIFEKNSSIEKDFYVDDNDEVLDDDIYEKLIELASINKKNNNGGTRKKNKKLHNKSKKNAK
jgi:hypothetical protein